MWSLKVMIAGRWERVGNFRTRTEAERAGLTHVMLGKATRYAIDLRPGFVGPTA